VSRRRSRTPHVFTVVLFVAVTTLGVALYDTAGAEPVALAEVVAALFVAFASSRPKRRTRRR
jgi:hypothetical protein